MGEYDPELDGVVQGRAQQAEFSPLGRRQMQQRDQGELGSAAKVELDPDWVMVKVEGSTTIEEIVADEFDEARIIILRFGASCTVKAGKNLKIAGDFNATLNDTLTLICNGTNWYEFGGRCVNE